ncbi:hypothetical protein FB440_1115 [Vibrio crassostreae]|uniref:hypothetical protein n=1 Tax=Vibrio crassostreae TaxID=246167 RepID=UPI00119BB0B9|nr:hypothetical protein [Vibrio crassostreae]TWD36113.1 hypothetical protein FB440_1115 [Vibrio crassostreae]
MCYLNDFPEFPSFEARWTPIYFEPILLSGERITIAIVIIGENGEFKVFQTLREDVLESLYGLKSKNLKTLIEHCEMSIKIHLSKTSTLDAWIPPFKGIYQGTTKLAADDSIFKVAQQAIQRSSSLSSLSMAAVQDYEDDSQQDLKTSQRWQESVIRSVLDIQPKFEPYFKVKVEIDQSKIKTQFGFLSDRSAINFGVLSGLSHSSSLNTIKARILDLEQLMNSNNLLLPQDYSVIIKTPAKDDISISSAVKDKLNDTIYTIENIGKKSEISIYTVDNSCAAAKQILEIAA